MNFVDPVARLSLFSSGFLHVGRVAYFDAAGRLHQDYSSRQTALSFWLRDLWRNPLLALSFRAHAMERYCALTEGAARAAGFDIT